MIQLSAVVITFNEEKNIERCILSLQKVADEVVVVDSFSTDQTKIICEKLNVTFVQHHFEGYIEQKNWAITKAKYPHVLSLDADETLNDELISSIKNVKSNWVVDGYSMNRMTNYCGKWIKHGSWYPDVKLRLWDSRKGSWTGVNPHDEYKIESNAVIKHLPGDILHYSYYSIEGHIDQVNHFTTILAKSMFDKGKKGTVVNLIVNPLANFIKDIILNRGFMDGFYGFVIAIISSHATFLKYLKLIELQKNEH